MMRFACPGCGAIYDIKETNRLTAAGGRVECFRCHEVFTVAVPRDEPASVSGEDAAAPAPAEDLEPGLPEPATAAPNEEAAPAEPRPAPTASVKTAEAAIPETAVPAPKEEAKLAEPEPAPAAPPEEPKPVKSEIAVPAPSEEAKLAESEPVPAAPAQEPKPVKSELAAPAPSEEAKPAESEPAPAAPPEEPKPVKSELAAPAPSEEAKPAESEPAPAAPPEEPKPVKSGPTVPTPKEETKPAEAEPAPAAPVEESKGMIPETAAQAQKEEAKPALREFPPTVAVKAAKVATPEPAAPARAGPAPGVAGNGTTGPQAGATEGTHPAPRRRPPRAAVEGVITGARHEYKFKQEPKQHLAVQGSFPNRSDTLSDQFEPPRRTVIPLPAWAEKAIWGIGAFLLLAFLVAQTLWHFRADPGVNVMLSAVCEDLGCDIPLLRRPSALRVTDRVFTRDPDYPNVLVLRLRVANGAGFPQPYPGLELVLYDKAQAVVGKSRVVPAQYRRNAATRALAPGDLGEIELFILDPGQAATGFAVDFF